MSEAGELWRTARDASADLDIRFDVVHVIAMLHWCRYNAMPVGRDHDDLQVAAVMFAHVLRVEPDLVPESLQEAIASAGVDSFEDNLGIPSWAEQSYSATQYPSSSNRIIVPDGPTWWARRAAVILRQSKPGDDAAPLNEAVHLLRRAVEATPIDRSDYAEFLFSLARALLVRFQQVRNAEDIDEAVSVSRAAVDLLDPDDARRAGTLINLGAALGIRFQEVADPADLDEAIEALRTAVKLTTQDHPHRKASMTSLGRALTLRFDRTGQQSDHDEAISIAEALHREGFSD